MVDRERSGRGRRDKIRLRGRSRGSGRGRYAGQLVVVGALLALLTVANAGARPSTVVASAAISVPTPTSNLSSIDLGMMLNLSVDVTMIVGGSNNSTNWHYTWLGLPAGCTSSDVANYTCTPTHVGSSNVSVRVHDASTGDNGTSPALQVNVSAALVIASFTAEPAQVGVGGTIQFRVNATGGTPPLIYNYQGLPSGCSSNVSSFSCVATSAHAYNATVFVTDGAGAASATLNVSILVTGNATGSTGSHPTTTEWGIIGAILVIGFVIVALLLWTASRVERTAYRAPGARPTSPPPGATPEVPGSSAPGGSASDEPISKG